MRSTGLARLEGVIDTAWLPRTWHPSLGRAVLSSSAELRHGHEVCLANETRTWGVDGSFPGRRFQSPCVMLSFSSATTAVPLARILEGRPPRAEA